MGHCGICYTDIDVSVSMFNAVIMQVAMFCDRISIRLCVCSGALPSNYRPQWSCGQGNVFTGVCLSIGGEGVCLSACWDAPPPRSRSPLDQADPPGPGRPPWDQADPPKPGRPPQTRQTPREAHSSIRSTSSRYASYWNAFLLLMRPLCTSRHPHVHPGTAAVNQTACNFPIKGRAFAIALHSKPEKPTVNISKRNYKISKIVYSILDLRKALTFHYKF